MIGRRKLLSLILLLPLVGMSRSPLWGQAAAPGAVLGTSSFFTTTDQVKLHYLDAGRGRPIVFVPGGWMPADTWEPQIREFSRDHRTIALDPRAHGRSEAGLQYEFSRLAADIHELIEHLGLSNVVLVGWSLAVKQVLTYVDRYGTDRLGTVVLVDGSVMSSGCVRATGLVKELESDRRAFVYRAIRGLFTQASEEYVRRVVEGILRMPTMVPGWLHLVGHCSPDSDKRAALTKLDRASIPVIYVIASPGFLPDADTLRSRVPSARVEVFPPEAGHAPAFNFPDRFNKVLREFLMGS